METNEIIPLGDTNLFRQPYRCGEHVFGVWCRFGWIKPSGRFQPVRNIADLILERPLGDIEYQLRNGRALDQHLHDLLLTNKKRQIVVLGRITRDLQAPSSRFDERIWVPPAEYQPKAESGQARLQPSEPIFPPAVSCLPHLS
jgi:hypothetical protein